MDSKETRRRPFQWLSFGLGAIVVLFGLPLLLMIIFGPHWKRIQVLRSADRQHVAQLERLYGYIDVNFRVSFDGVEIHRSWDCAPNESLPFRETLAWDESGNVLVFQLANEIVYAYDIPSDSVVDPADFSAIVLPTITLKDIGFEGESELRRRTSADGLKPAQ